MQKRHETLEIKKSESKSQPSSILLRPLSLFLGCLFAKCVRDKKEASAGVILHIIQTGIDWKGIKNMQNIIKKAFFFFMRVFILHSILKLSRVGRGVSARTGYEKAIIIYRAIKAKFASYDDK